MGDLPHPASALVGHWASHLAHDRRRSPHTVRAYSGSANRLIEFLGAYRGEEIVPAALHTRPTVAVIDIDLPGWMA